METIKNTMQVTVIIAIIAFIVFTLLSTLILKNMSKPLKNMNEKC